MTASLTLLESNNMLIFVNLMPIGLSTNARVFNWNKMALYSTSLADVLIWTITPHLLYLSQRSHRCKVSVFFFFLHVQHYFQIMIYSNGIIESWFCTCRLTLQSQSSNFDFCKLGKAVKISLHTQKNSVWIYP